MKKIRLQNGFNYTFAHKKLPKVIIKLIVEDLKKPKNLPLLKYLKKEYRIKFSELINEISDNLKVLEDSVSVIVEIDSTAIIKHGLKLVTALDFINNGNLELRGTNSINNVFNYVQTNINTLYKLYLVRKEGILWE